MYKPVILIGNGARSNPALVKALCSLNIPILVTWQGIDLVPEDSPAFCGRPGIFGQRAANIIQQKADALYCFGARLDGEQVAYDYDRFAPNADIHVFDVDRMELEKLPERYRKNCVNLAALKDAPVKALPDNEWLDWCKALYVRFRPELDGKHGGKFVDPFAFTKALSDACEADDLLAIGSSGGAPCVFLQAFQVKEGQKVSNVSTIGAMGADIPMSIGAAIATGRRTICVTGDGGFMLNSQELETAHRLGLPITWFVMRNGGYNSIRVMQNARFDGRLVGCNAESGLTLPPLEELAYAYRLHHEYLNILDELPRILGYGPQIVEVSIDPDWQELPRVMASTVNGQLRTDDMERMTPKLDPDELDALMKWGNDA